MNYQNSAYIQQSSQEYQYQPHAGQKQHAGGQKGEQSSQLINYQQNANSFNHSDNQPTKYTIQPSQNISNHSQTNPYTSKINQYQHHHNIHSQQDQLHTNHLQQDININNENMNYENIKNKGQQQLLQDYQRSFSKQIDNNGIMQNKMPQNRPLQQSINSNNSNQSTQLQNSQLQASQYQQNQNSINKTNGIQFQKIDFVKNIDQNPEISKNQNLKINVTSQEEKNILRQNQQSQFMQQNLYSLNLSQNKPTNPQNFEQETQYNQQFINGSGQQKGSQIQNQISQQYLNGNNQNTASSSGIYGQPSSSQNTQIILNQIASQQSFQSKDYTNQIMNNSQLGQSKEPKQNLYAQKNLDESVNMIILNSQQDMNQISQQKNDSNLKLNNVQIQNGNSLSQGPITVGGLHSSGGSLGSQSYNSISVQNMARSKTHGRIGFGQKKTNILQMIKCPCHPEQTMPHLDLIVSNRGKKQPILHSSENTANCGHCGQFYAVKDQQITHFSASGKKQITTQAQIIKTIRERTSIFKLDEPISEIFRRMREVSQKVLDKLDPNSFYLTKRIKRIDNLSYIADTLQSENQTIHHAVHLMDIYSSKVPKNEEYDTVLISLVCLLISTKYLQIKYPGADALNYQVNNRYNSDLIIQTEGKVLEIIDWQLMVFPLFDYVKLFISQGCLFENEKILPNMNLQPQDRIEKPTVQLAEHFRKYAEFFADFCLYQQCFMTVDPYLLSCAIVAYTRKYMGVAIIWRHELELLTKCTFHHFRELYLIIESKYKENFPEHANSQNHKDQLLTEPIANQLINPQGNMRKNLINQLQLSSGGKTKQSQNSSNKHATSANNTNITNNIFGELKTPDKYVFDFNSVVSENKNTTQNKGGFSHDKFQISSNSVEKYKGQKKIVNTHQHQKIADIQTNQNNKTTGMVFSDNKRQSINAHSFKKLILKNQTNNTLSDEKKLTNTNVQNQLETNPENYMQYQKRAAQAARNTNQSKMIIQDMAQNQSSQKSQATNFPNQTQACIGQGNSVTSPSANIGEAENEEEVPPFKPMIIKSNSQAISGGFECKTTTKKSPKGEDLEKLNNLKESMKSVNITAKLPSSTTNQSASNSNLNSFQKATTFNLKDNMFSNRKSTGGFGSLGFGVGHGPIKISQKITIVNSSNKKGQVNGIINGGQVITHSTGEKHKSNSNNGAGGTTSSQKLKVSKSYISNLQSNEALRQNLSKSYQKQLAEQRARNQSSEALTKSCIQTSQQVIDLKQNHIGNQTITQFQIPQRNSSCSSTNNVHSNPHFKQQSYVSGKAKINIGSYVQNNKIAISDQLKDVQNYGGIQNKGSVGSIGAFDIQSNGGRSILSVKNAAEVIKRKGSNFHNNQTIDLRLNINKAQPQINEGADTSILINGDVSQQLRGKNVPNGLLRRATGGAQGRQKSIGHLSNYMPNGNNTNIKKEGFAQSQYYPDVDSQGSIEGKRTTQFEQYLPRNISIEDLSNQEELNQQYLLSLNKNQNHQLVNKKTVNPPAIMNSKSQSKNMHQNDIQFQEQNNESTLSHTKAALQKINNNYQIDPVNNDISSRPITQFQTSNNTRLQSNERPSNLSVKDNFHTSFQQDNVFQTNLQPNLDSKDIIDQNNHDIYNFQNSYSKNDDNYAQCNEDQQNKPVQKMIKSGSQVLGKCRSRLNLSRREMLKQLNDKKEKMSHMVEAAHATRPTSNERDSTSKPKVNEITINSNDLSIEREFDNNIRQQQLYTTKNSQNGVNNNNRFNMAAQFDIQQFEDAMNSHSQERPQTENNLKQSKSSNIHTIGNHQNIQYKKSTQKNNEKYLNDKKDISAYQTNKDEIVLNNQHQQSSTHQNYPIIQSQEYNHGMLSLNKQDSKGSQKQKQQQQESQYQSSLIQKAAVKSMQQQQMIHQSNSNGRLATQQELQAQAQQQFMASQSHQQQIQDKEIRKIHHQQQLQMQMQSQQQQIQKQKQQMQAQTIRNSKLE